MIFLLNESSKEAFEYVEEGWNKIIASLFNGTINKQTTLDKLDELKVEIQTLFSLEYGDDTSSEEKFKYAGLFITLENMKKKQ